MSLSGSIGLVGASLDDIGANSNQGSAYVFRSLDTATGSTTQNVKLTASDGAAGDIFGESVGLDGDQFVIGAYGKNSFTGNTLVINGAVTSTSVVVNGSLSGSGVMATATLSGSGSINPGNSPGVMTAAATDPTGGLDYNFEFTAGNTLPTWNAPTASGNDVLRLTTIPTPFTASLSAANEVNIYLNAGALQPRHRFPASGFRSRNGERLHDAIHRRPGTRHLHASRPQPRCAAHPQAP